MTAPVETEFKLRASRPLEVAAVDAAIRELGIGCRSATATQHVDTYLDDATGSLARAGIGLRLRLARAGNRVTCKSRGKGTNGLFVREEHEAEWPGTGAPRTAGDLPPELRDLVEPFTVDRPLTSVLQLAVHRDARVLQNDERDLCELAIDHVEATAAGRSANFCEVELEVVDDVPGNERLANALLQRLPLHAAEDDKPTHAAVRLGLPQPTEALFELQPESPLADVVTNITNRHLDVMRRAETGVRGDRDPEHLHVMRVAVRRLRSIVRAFRDLWPQPTATLLLDQLGDTGRKLGSVRDLDVLLAGIGDDVHNLPSALLAAAERAKTWIVHQRDEAREQLQTWLRSDARLHAFGELERNLAAFDRASPMATAPVGATLPNRLARAVETLRKLAGAIAPDLPVEPMHNLRIASKRLRYLAEEFAQLPHQDYGKSLEVIATLQQALGVVCDHEVAAERLIGWIHPVAAASPDGAMTAAAIGGLAARQAQQARKARKAAMRALVRTDRPKVWKRFPTAAPPDANLAS